MDFINTPEVAEVNKEIQTKEHDLRKWLLIYRIGITVALGGLSAIAICLVLWAITQNSNFGGAAGLIVFIGVFVIPFGFLELPDLRDRLLKMRQEIFDLKQVRRDLIAQATNSPRTKYIRYKDSLQDLVAYYKVIGNRYRRTHNALQVVTIIGSAITSTLIAAAGDLPWARWAGASVALILGASAGLSSYFKFNDKSATLQKAADDIETETRAFDLAIGDYESTDDEEKMIRFVKKIEDVRTEQANRTRDLDQISDQITFNNQPTSRP
ncbi:DUF4231 domain-containing protein [Nonomuraea jabiensis]|uniref:DUF4231 domain-containing protein n=1 Tax=Nonomuraea jabiensis TaxID=882448 RepID=UPI0034240275